MRMFRNLRLYRLHGPWPQDEETLSARLAVAAFTPCSAVAERSAGWEPPAEGGDALCRRVGAVDLMRLRTQTRILPAAAVNEALEVRLQAFRQRTQRDPSRRERRELKDEVAAELLPRALLRSARTRGLFLLSENILAIDTASASQAEHFMDCLRAALGTLQVVPVAFSRPIGELLTKLFLGDGPRSFSAGRECRMQDPSLGGAYVHWSDMELADSSVRRHVRDGLRLDRLAIVYDELLSGVLDQEGVLRKVKLQGVDGEQDGIEDPRARLDAELALFAGTLKRLLTDLAALLGGYANADRRAIVASGAELDLEVEAR
jgi:recombination associated protein RdgC